MSVSVIRTLRRKWKSRRHPFLHSSVSRLQKCIRDNEDGYEHAFRALGIQSVLDLIERIDLTTLTAQHHAYTHRDLAVAGVYNTQWFAVREVLGRREDGEAITNYARERWGHYPKGGGMAFPSCIFGMLIVAGLRGMMHLKRADIDEIRDWYVEHALPQYRSATHADHFVALLYAIDGK